MRRDEQSTVTASRSTSRTGLPAGEHQRTTLSLLVATGAVAVSAFLGLGQAAAAATDADARATGAVDPAHPVATGPSDLVVMLDRLTRLPEANPEAAAVAEFEPAAPATTTTEAPDGTVPTSSSSVSSSSSTSSSSSSSSSSSTSLSSSTSDPDRDQARRPASTTTRPTTAPTVPTTTSAAVPPTTTAAPFDPAAIRTWQPVSNAAFRRFVDERNFTTVEYLTPGLVHGTIVEPDQSINVVLVHRSATAPMRVSPGDRGREEVGAWANAIGATAGINGNWYSPWDGPAVSGGRVYGGRDHGYTALFGFTDTGDLVADHHHKVHDRVDPRVAEAVSGHPTLIHRGVATTDFGGDPTFTKRNPRTAIGVTATVDVLILVTVDGRRSSAVGMTGAETTRLLQRLGAFDAVMLDGGGSSAMWIAGRGIVNRQSDPGRAVGNQIAVFGR